MWLGRKGVGMPSGAAARPTDRRSASTSSLVPSLAADQAGPTAGCPRTRRTTMVSDEASTFAGRSPQLGDARAADRRYDCLDDAARLARRYLDGLRTRPVRAEAGLDELRAVLACPLTDEGEDPSVIVESLAGAVDPGLVASGG